MSELGSLLELIHDAHARVTSLTAEYRDCISPRPSLELQVQRSELGEMRTRWRGAGPFPRTVATTRRIWLSAPDKLRVEVVTDRQLVRLGVLNGEQWWRWDSAEGTISSEISSNGGVQAPPPLLTPPLINPAPLLAALRFEALGPATRIGRKVMSARAWLRHPSRTSRTLCYELEFDAEHGTILRRATLEDGHLVSVTEAVDVAYGASIEREQFVFVQPKSTRQLRPAPGAGRGRAFA